MPVIEQNRILFVPDTAKYRNTQIHIQTDNYSKKHSKYSKKNK